MQVNSNIQKLSYEGCVNILSELKHVVMSSFNDCNDKDEAHELMKQVIQHNLNDGLLDGIEILITLSGE